MYIYIYIYINIYIYIKINEFSKTREECSMVFNSTEQYMI